MTHPSKQTPQGWTAQGQPRGWLRRVKSPTDAAVDSLKRENSELRDMLAETMERLARLESKKRGR